MNVLIHQLRTTAADASSIDASLQGDPLSLFRCGFAKTPAVVGALEAGSFEPALDLIENLTEIARAGFPDVVSGKAILRLLQPQAGNVIVSMREPNDLIFKIDL
jgi:hypothetical protein